jgi:ATP-binding cassette subfamily C protein
MFRAHPHHFTSARSDLAVALRECSGALVGIVIFSGLMNVLTLTGPIFMLQVYDRVVPSKSISTILKLKSTPIIALETA